MSNLVVGNLSRRVGVSTAGARRRNPEQQRRIMNWRSSDWGFIIHANIYFPERDPAYLSGASCWIQRGRSTSTAVTAMNAQRAPQISAQQAAIVSGGNSHPQSNRECRAGGPAKTSGTR